MYEDRSSTDFRARREALGMTQGLLAHLLEVDIRTVKRWENPATPWEPPEDAWQLIDQYTALQAQVVDEACDRAYDARELHGTGTVQLAYWHDRDEYEAAHPGEGPYWRMANANSRLTGAILSMDGFEVRYGFQGLASLDGKG